MEPCDCSNSLCISKEEDPLKALRDCISELFRRYKIIINNAGTLMEATRQVIDGVKGDEFTRSKCKWLGAKFQIYSCKIYIYKHVRYVENCKTAQSVLNSNLEQEIYFRAYLELKKILDNIEEFRLLDDETIKSMSSKVGSDLTEYFKFRGKNYEVCQGLEKYKY